MVDGKDVVDAKQADRVGGLTGIHCEAATYRQTDQIGFVKFTDDFHVAKDRGIARIVQCESSGQPYD